MDLLPNHTGVARNDQRLGKAISSCIALTKMGSGVRLLVIPSFLLSYVLDDLQNKRNQSKIYVKLESMEIIAQKMGGGGERR